MTSTGTGALELFRYAYSGTRVAKSQDDNEVVSGNILRLQVASLAEQPINAFDWSNEKKGLFACTAFDQQVRVGMVTRL